MELDVIESIWPELTVEQRRGMLVELVEQSKSLAPEHHVHNDPIQLYADGLYSRSLPMYAGTLIVGEIHKQGHMSVLTQGVVRVADEHGIRTIRAPTIFVSEANVQRAIYVIEDTMWTTFHATDHKDEESVRKQLIAPNYAAIGKTVERPDVLGNYSSRSAFSSRVECVHSACIEEES